MSFEREMRRRKLKQEIGSNKIKDIFHTRYDTLEQRLIRGMKEARKENKNARKKI